MTRRFICRAIFIALCVAPTLAIASWSAIRVVDSGARAQLAAIGQRLGVRIECRTTQTPRPGVYVLSGLALCEPESGVEIARCDTLQADLRGDAMALACGELSLEMEQMATAVELVGRLIRNDWPAALRLTCDQVSVRDGDSSIGQWDAVQAKLKPLSGDAKLGRELEFRSGAFSGQHRDGARLLVTRNRQLTPAATRVTLQTGRQAIAWRLLATAAPADLNPEATFQGEFSITLSESVSEGAMQGRLAEVSLPSLLAVDPAALQLDQPATMEIQQLAWKDERVERLQLLLTTGSGAADPAWVFAVNTHLRCGASESLQEAYKSARDAPLAFDELAVVIGLDASGLQLRGACRDAQGQPMPCVLAANNTPLLYHPNEPKLPLVTALRFLAPGDAALRPSSPLADKVARRLPLESSVNR